MPRSCNSTMGQQNCWCCDLSVLWINFLTQKTKLGNSQGPSTDAVGAHCREFMIAMKGNQPTACPQIVSLRVPVFSIQFIYCQFFLCMVYYSPTRQQTIQLDHKDNNSACKHNGSYCISKKQESAEEINWWCTDKFLDYVGSMPQNLGTSWCDSFSYPFIVLN